MKRFKLPKLKRFSPADISELDDQAYEDKWLLKSERLQARKWRRFKQQLTT